MWWLRLKSAQKGQAVGCDGVLGALERTPDGCCSGQTHVARRERLDAQRTSVPGLVQRSQYALPVRVIGARRAAIVATHLHMRDPTAGGADGRWRVLFF